MNEAGWWDRFHAVHCETEWYGAGDTGVRLLPHERGRLLHVGCGTSTLGDALAAAAGVSCVLSTDFSPAAIEIQVARWAVAAGANTGGTQAFAVEDACDLLSHADASFSAVVDKGTLDAILADRAGTSLARGRAAVGEWVRVGGGHVLIGSMIHPDTRLRDLEAFLEGSGGEHRIAVHAVPEPPLEKPSQPAWWWYVIACAG